jgi:hypothetical protein
MVVDSRSRAAVVGATVLAISSTTKPAILDEVAHDYLARRFAESEESRCLMNVKGEAWHFRIRAKDQSHDMWPCRFGVSASCRTASLELACRR